MSDHGFNAWWEDTGLDLTVDHINLKYLRSVMKSAYMAGFFKAVDDEVKAIKNANLMMFKEQAE